MIVSDNRQSDVDNLQSDADHLQSDADHCRRASDYLLRDQENSRSHHENLLVRADYGRRNLDYCLDDSNSLHDDGDHRHGRKEDGVDRAGHGLQGFVFISIFILLGKIETALLKTGDAHLLFTPTKLTEKTMSCTEHFGHCTINAEIIGLWRTPPIICPWNW